MTKSGNRLYFYLEQYFAEWILQLDEPNYNQRVQINKNNSYFVNFNYTATLETAYGINRNSICYIHGCAALNQHLIFGHDQTPETIKEKWHYDSIANGKEVIEEAVGDMGTLYKDVNAIIKTAVKYGKNCLTLTQYIYGDSLYLMLIFHI